MFEARVAECTDELLEAALEGRQSGINQIWAELGSDNDAKQAVWRALKARPDLFKVIKGVLEESKLAATGNRSEQRSREPGEDDDKGEETLIPDEAIPATLKAKIAANSRKPKGGA